ncbi:hypothetical protein WME95_00180 [Sorangium sp. So ce327]|jgi:hypothetical protein|uniref:hypothetical protein n=1 Tax=Sorangium sp. So ce327 TaxID=3133301 RepID=UPI003F5ED5EB
MPAEPITAAQIFERFFAPQYPPDALVDLAGARSTDANPAGNPSILAQIDHAAEVFARLAPAAFGAPDLGLDFSDASVHRLGAALTRERRDAWLAPAGGPSDARGSSGASAASGGGEPPMLVTLVTHGALYVGACVVKNHGGKWQVRRPLWESLVRLESSAGTGDLAIFQWWLKALSDEEIGRGRLVDRYRTHVEVPTFDAERLPILAAGDRRIPKLAKVRYDTLYKHLRAHLPELRSVGDDFPSPERFEELGFKSMEFALLGGGRMLLMHGATADGVHLLWLDASGFVKSLYYPADSFPAHVVQIEGQKIRVIVPVRGESQVHEMLWWGA